LVGAEVGRSVGAKVGVGVGSTVAIGVGDAVGEADGSAGSPSSGLPCNQSSQSSTFSGPAAKITAKADKNKARTVSQAIHALDFLPISTLDGCSAMFHASIPIIGVSTTIIPTRSVFSREKLP
jgi:hypothetical protein